MRLLSLIFFVCFTFLLFSVHGVHAATQPKHKQQQSKLLLQASKKTHCSLFLKICQRHCKADTQCYTRCKRENHCG